MLHRRQKQLPQFNLNKNKYSHNIQNSNLVLLFVKHWLPEISICPFSQDWNTNIWLRILWKLSLFMASMKLQDWCKKHVGYVLKQANTLKCDRKHADRWQKSDPLCASLLMHVTQKNDWPDKELWLHEGTWHIGPLIFLDTSLNKLCSTQNTGTVYFCFL